MADNVTKEVSIKFTADTSALRSAMKEASKLADEWNKKHQGGTGEKGKQKKGGLLPSTRSLKAGTKAMKEMTASYKEVVPSIVSMNKALEKQVNLLGQMRESLKAIRRDQRAVFGGGGVPGGPGGGAGESGGSESSRRRLSSALKPVMNAAKMVGKMIVRGIGAFVGYGVNALRGGYRSYQNLGKAQASLLPFGRNPLAPNQQGFDTSTLGRGALMGYNQAETAQQAAAVGKQTGNARNVFVAQQVSRLTGMGVGEVGGFMGALTRGGEDFVRSEASANKMERILRDAVKSGLDVSRTGEHLSSVASLVQQGQQSYGGKIASESISTMLAAIGGRLGKGFQGARGAKFLSAIDTGIKGGGGSEAGKAFLLQALGYGRPDKGVSYYEARKRMEQGILGGTKEQGARNLADIFNYAARQGQGKQKTNIMLNEMFGVSLDQIERFRSKFDEGGLEALQKEIATAVPPEMNLNKAASILAKNNEEMIKVVQAMAQDENRRMNMGKQIYDAVREFVKVMHKFMDSTIIPLMIDLLKKFMPPLVEGIKALTPAIQHLTEWLSRDVFGIVGEREKKSIERVFSFTGKGGYQEQLRKARDEVQKEIDRRAKTPETDDDVAVSGPGRGVLEEVMQPYFAVVNEIGQDQLFRSGIRRISEKEEDDRTPEERALLNTVGQMLRYTADGRLDIPGSQTIGSGEDAQTFLTERLHITINQTSPGGNVDTETGGTERPPGTD